MTINTISPYAETPETVYVGYSPSELAQQATAEREAFEELAAYRARKLAEQAAAQREAYAALAALRGRWQARAALDRLEVSLGAIKPVGRTDQREVLAISEEPFMLTRRVKVPVSAPAPVSGVRVRNRSKVRFLSQGIAAVVAALVG